MHDASLLVLGFVAGVLVTYVVLRRTMTIR